MIQLQTPNMKKKVWVKNVFTRQENVENVQFALQYINIKIAHLRTYVILVSLKFLDSALYLKNNLHWNICSCQRVCVYQYASEWRILGGGSN